MKFLVALHVFIDTNIYLSFYHYTDDDLEALKNSSQHLINAVSFCIYLTMRGLNFDETERRKSPMPFGNSKLRNTVSKFPQLVQLDANHTALSVAERIL